VKKNKNGKEWDGQIWSGVYNTFAEAGGDDGVFEDTKWLKKQTVEANHALERSRSAGAMPEIAQTTDYALPVVAAVIAQPHQTLKILDFGGGMASSFLPLVAMLPTNQALKFVVVENKALSDEGEKLFKNEKRLYFCTEIPIDEKFHVIHAGSSFHYVADWIALLRLFAQMRPQYLIFADLPAGDIDTFVTIQNYYGKKIPVRFWNLVEFIRRVEELDFKLVMKARYYSYYIAAMDGFDQKHRLNYFTQLIFKGFHSNY